MAKNYGNESRCNCGCDYSATTGNAIDIRIDDCQSEIRADILVEEYKTVRIWGQVINCDGYPVSNALVKLLRVAPHKDGYCYQGIAHTMSDCEGFYQFDVCGYDDCKDYKVIVSKPDYGPERVEVNPEGNCYACEDCNQPEPCHQNKPNVNQNQNKEYPPVDDYYWRPEKDNGNYGCGCN